MKKHYLFTLLLFILLSSCATVKNNRLEASALEISELKTLILEAEIKIRSFQAVTLKLNAAKSNLTIVFDEWIALKDETFFAFDKMLEHSLYNSLIEKNAFLEGTPIKENLWDLQRIHIKEIEEAIHVLRDKRYFNTGLMRQILYNKDRLIIDASNTIHDCTTYIDHAFLVFIEELHTEIDNYSNS